jgi:hypothetical protein
MRRTWKVLLVLVLVVLAFAAAFFGYVLTGTPLFGPKLELKDIPIKSIELSMFSARRVITASNQCAQVIQTMRKAREGYVYTAVQVGTLTLCYTDGTTNMFYLQPGDRMNRLDLVNQSGSHSISLSEMFGVLRRVGLLDRQER